MQSEELSKQTTQIQETKQEIVIDENKQAELQSKVLRLFQVLHQINLKKKIVKNSENCGIWFNKYDAPLKLTNEKVVIGFYELLDYKFVSFLSFVT